MDQVKIGKFIAQRRKLAKLTQIQLAEKLSITDRAVSKWERGLALPDSSIMLELCDILGISVNDLLSGEVVTMEHYNKELENNLLEVIKQKEQADKQLLSLEIFVGFVASALMIATIFAAAFVPMDNWVRIVLIVTGMIVFAIGITYALKIEQIAGYYHCAKCGHRYVPSYRSMLFAMHVNRTRYMKCPACNQKSWQKKVISK